MACCSVKFPVMMPLPAVIGLWTTGFEMIVRSTAIAIWFVGGGWFTAAVVAAANLLAPSLSRVNATAHCVIGSVCVPPVSCAEAFVMLLPMITTGPRCTFAPGGEPAACE